MGLSALWGRYRVDTGHWVLYFYLYIHFMFIVGHCWICNELISNNWRNKHAIMLASAFWLLLKFEHNFIVCSFFFLLFFSSNDSWLEFRLLPSKARAKIRFDEGDYGLHMARIWLAFVVAHCPSLMLKSSTKNHRRQMNEIHSSMVLCFVLKR